tara:strand:- start:1013 stop:1897 length:885 start_codon:yes stop_codon:yes gene_type:complete
MNKYIILIPLFNDWKSVSKLLDKIDIEVDRWNAHISVVIVNDASTEAQTDLDKNFKKIKSIKILNMKENTMHQRCIAAGIKYICKNEDFDRLIVMDADGEDRPEELNIFYKKAQENPKMSITGNRFKRSEGFIFITFYEIHKILTFIFTGKQIKFGNFTCLTKTHAQELVGKAYLWNSYSSSVIRTINQRTSIPSKRGVRYVLPSKMNFLSLIFHSLSIMSVFRKILFIRTVSIILFYMFLISNNISLLTLIPILFLLIFLLVILKISTRSSLKGLDKSLNNINSISILGKVNN